MREGGAGERATVPAVCWQWLGEVLVAAWAWQGLVTAMTNVERAEMCPRARVRAVT